MQFSRRFMNLVPYGSLRSCGWVKLLTILRLESVKQVFDKINVLGAKFYEVDE